MHFYHAECPQKKDESITLLFIGGFYLFIYAPNEMVVNSLQNGLIKSQIAPRASGLNSKKKTNFEHILFSLIDFYCENNLA
jgi:hypothetical protein